MPRKPVHPRINEIKQWIEEGKTTFQISLEFQIPESQVRNFRSRWEKRQELLAKDSSTSYQQHLEYCRSNQILPDLNWEPKPPSKPCHANVGTKERISVYQARMERGEDLWHPEDDNGPLAPLTWLGEYSAKPLPRQRRNIKDEDYGRVS